VGLIPCFSHPTSDTFNNDLEEGIASERGLVILEKFNANFK